MPSYMNIDDQVERLTESVEKLMKELKMVKEMVEEMKGEGEETETDDNSVPDFPSFKNHAPPPAPPEVKKAPTAKKK